MPKKKRRWEWQRASCLRLSTSTPRNSATAPTLSDSCILAIWGRGKTLRRYDDEDNNNIIIIIPIIIIIIIVMVIGTALVHCLQQILYLIL